jgi:hypothetical protein
MKKRTLGALLGAVATAVAVAALGVGPAAAADTGSGSFLCYAVGGAPLYVPDEATAQAHLAAGNWLPEAVPGNVPPGLGENVGAYHLDCFDAPLAGGFGNVTATDLYADANGTTLSASYVTGAITNGIGVYPIYGLPATT